MTPHKCFACDAKLRGTFFAETALLPVMCLRCGGRIRGLIDRACAEPLDLLGVVLVGLTDGEGPVVCSDNPGEDVFGFLDRVKIAHAKLDVIVSRRSTTDASGKITVKRKSKKAASK